MKHYTHHVPGRLRVKIPALKRDEAKVILVRAQVLAMEGVKTAEINILTGSLVIGYDVAETAPEAILHALHQAGHLSTETAVGAERRTDAPVGNIGGRLGKALVEALVGHALERSAVALIGALL